MSVLTGENIERFRWNVIEKGLSLEVRTGMGHSRNANVRAARQLLTNSGIKPARVKRQLLAQFSEWRAKKNQELQKATVSPVFHEGAD